MIPERLLKRLGLMKGLTERMSSNVHTAVATLQFCSVICPVDQVQLKKLEKQFILNVVQIAEKLMSKGVTRCHSN